MNRTQQAKPGLEIHSITKTNSGRTIVKMCLKGIPHGIAFSGWSCRIFFERDFSGSGARVSGKDLWHSVGVRKKRYIFIYICLHVFAQVQQISFHTFDELAQERLAPFSCLSPTSSLLSFRCFVPVVTLCQTVHYTSAGTKEEAKQKLVACASCSLTHSSA